MLIRNRVHRFKNRVYETAKNIYLPGLIVPKHRNILLVLENDSGKELMAAHNIVTNAGDTYYAQKACGESPTNAFANLKLSTANWNASHPAKGSNTGNIASQITGSNKAVTATYPKTNDSDTDNTGAGADIITWLFSYGKADFSDTDIDAGAISTSAAALGTGTDPLLTAFDLTTFAKTTNDTLKVFVNHEVTGV